MKYNTKNNTHTQTYIRQNNTVKHTYTNKPFLFTQQPILLTKLIQILTL